MVPALQANSESTIESTGDCEDTCNGNPTCFGEGIGRLLPCSNWPRDLGAPGANPGSEDTVRFCIKCYNSECSLIVIFDHMGCGVIGSMHV